MMDFMISTADRFAEELLYSREGVEFFNVEVMDSKLHRNASAPRRLPIEMTRMSRQKGMTIIAICRRRRRGLR